MPEANALRGSLAFHFCSHVAPVTRDRARYLCDSSGGGECSPGGRHNSAHSVSCLPRGGTQSSDQRASEPALNVALGSLQVPRPTLKGEDGLISVVQRPPLFLLDLSRAASTSLINTSAASHSWWLCLD